MNPGAVFKRIKLYEIIIDGFEVFDHNITLLILSLLRVYVPSLDRRTDGSVYKTRRGRKCILRILPESPSNSVHLRFAEY
jgi:hypothetical protein